VSGMSIGFRVYEKVERAPAALVKRLAECDTADIADVTRQAATMRGLHRIGNVPGRIAGTAITVSLPLGGVNMLKMAMAQLRKGDVLVVSTRGSADFAMFGGLLAGGMHKRGVAAMVVDGYVRDADEIAESGFPMFARGVVPNACLADAPGEVNVPIACGGVVVFPGSIIVADTNGVACVQAADAAYVADKVAELHGKHVEWGPLLAKGEFPGMDSARKAVTDQGCAFIG